MKLFLKYEYAVLDGFSLFLPFFSLFYRSTLTDALSLKCHVIFRNNMASLAFPVSFKGPEETPRTKAASLNRQKHDWFDAVFIM